MSLDLRFADKLDNHGLLKLLCFIYYFTMQRWHRVNMSALGTLRVTWRIPRHDANAGVMTDGDRGRAAS